MNSINKALINQKNLGNQKKFYEFLKTLTPILTI